MKRLLLAVFSVLLLCLPVRAANKASTLLIHPGEVVYARFEMNGLKLKLVSFSKEKDEAAQVIFSLQPDPKKPLFILKVENKFSRDLTYKAEMRSLTLKKRFVAPTSPVVGGKVAFENFPVQVEEIAATEFKLEK